MLRRLSINAIKEYNDIYSKKILALEFPIVKYLHSAWLAIKKMNIFTWET